MAVKVAHLSSDASDPQDGRYAWLALALIAAAALVAYHNSFQVPFLLDDDRAIATNASIRHLWPISDVLAPPPFSGTSGRPLLNLTFALNYALGGDQVLGYHVLNFLLHLLAGGVLFGAVRRLLLSPGLHERFGGHAAWLSTCIAVIWTVHPVQTESVTYVSQRAEVLMGLFYLLTIYGFLRATENRASGIRKWYIVSIACCWLGMAAKEVMVTAPCIVFLIDWIFIAGSFSAAWRARWAYYLGLASSWLVLVALMQQASRSVGFQQGVSSWVYALTESRAVVHYLLLALWPSPLVFDYGPQFIRNPVAALPYACGLILLITVVLFSFRRWPAAAFLGAWFFIILSPTSSVVPIALQPMAENRLYLPLAAVTAGVVMLAYRILGGNARWFAVTLVAAAIVGTVLRNDDYRDPITLWRDTLAKQPDNSRAHDNFGNALDGAGRLDEAAQQYQEALQLMSDREGGRTHYNLGVVLYKQGKFDQAIREYEEALKWEPSYAAARTNLAAALAAAGRGAEAQQLQEESLRNNSGDANSHYNLGLTYFGQGRLADAQREYEQALATDPSLLPCRDALGTVLFQQGHAQEAVAQFQQVLQANPNLAVTHNNLGTAWLGLGRLDEAGAEFERALQLRPDYPEAHGNLGTLLLHAGDIAGAEVQYREALRLEPTYEEAHYRLGNLLARTGRLENAIVEWQQAVKLRPNDAEAHNNLGLAFARTGRVAEAIGEYEIVVKLRPDLTEAQENLNVLRARQNGGSDPAR